MSLAARRPEAKWTTSEGEDAYTDLDQHSSSSDHFHHDHDHEILHSCWIGVCAKIKYWQRIGWEVKISNPLWPPPTPDHLHQSKIINLFKSAPSKSSDACSIGSQSVQLCPTISQTSEFLGFDCKWFQAATGSTSIPACSIPSSRLCLRLPGWQPATYPAQNWIKIIWMVNFCRINFDDLRREGVKNVSMESVCQGVSTTPIPTTPFAELILPSK